MLSLAVMLGMAGALAATVGGGGNARDRGATGNERPRGWPTVDARAFAHQGLLAFASGGSLYVLDGGTGALRQVGHLRTGAEGPSFSQDGRWLAYIAVGKKWASLPEQLGHRLRELATPTNGDTIRAHLETCPTVGSIQAAITLLASDDHLDIVVIVDDRGRPPGVADLDAAAIGTAAHPLCVNLDTSVAQAVQRALRRPRSIRFMPVVATDNAGRYAGTAHIERLADALAR